VPLSTALIALGTNLGARRLNLDRALARLRAEPDIWPGSCSSFYETEPVGGPPGQLPYFNAVLQVRTSLTARELIARLLEIERDMGRTRSEPNAPRVIDLDLLFHSNTILNEPDVIVPHPRLHDRPFVLAPLVEIAPSINHPVLHRTAADLLTAAGGTLPWTTTQPFPGVRRLRELESCRALVTGATSGIGRATAIALAAAGAWVIVHGRRTEAANNVAQECLMRAGHSHAIIAGFSESETVTRLASDSWSHWEGLDILISFAGADTLTGAARTLSFDAKLEELWKVDVQATIQICRDIGRRMQQQGVGSIITMTWDQAEPGMEGDSGQLFSSTKAAVLSFSRSLALSLAPRVRVNCLAPGWIRTAWGESASKIWQDRVRAQTPLSRWGTPEDVAQATRWLASPAASFITGQIIRVNGGAVR
jgi:2-amino-4-hydroxy-6-hydroxymethyldihydropteridine diphosphokinase